MSRLNVGELKQEIKDLNAIIDALTKQLCATCEERAESVFIDSGGIKWYMRDGRLRCVGDNTSDGGFECDGMWQAAEVLKREGYL